MSDERDPRGQDEPDDEALDAAELAALEDDRGMADLVRRALAAPPRGPAAAGPRDPAAGRGSTGSRRPQHVTSAGPAEIGSHDRRSRHDLPISHRSIDLTRRCAAG